MAIKDLLKKKKTDEAVEVTADAPKKAAKKAAPKKAKKSEEVSAAPAAQANTTVNPFASSFLVRPHVSEKAAVLMEKRAQYTFDVPVSAEKVAIKKAVEALYGVKVTGISTVRHAGKPVYRGKRASARNTWKKAVVTLAKGQKIDLYQGV